MTPEELANLIEQPKLVDEQSPEIEQRAKEISGLKAELENYRSIAEKAGATIAVSQLEQFRQEISILKLKLKEIR